MQTVTETEADMDIEAPLLEVVRTLPAQDRRALLSYALFLRHQEEERRIEADEAEWDRLFNDPVKMARFEEWERQALAEHPPEPLDDSRL